MHVSKESCLRQNSNEEDWFRETWHESSNASLEWDYLGSQDGSLDSSEGDWAKGLRNQSFKRKALAGWWSVCGKWATGEVVRLSVQLNTETGAKNWRAGKVY